MVEFCSCGFFCRWWLKDSIHSVTKAVRAETIDSRKAYLDDIMWLILPLWDSYLYHVISFKSHWIYSRVRRQVRCNRSCLRFVFWEGFIKTRSMVLQWLTSQERVVFCFQACKISCLVQAMTSNCGCVIYELKYNNMSVCYMENTKIGMRYLLGSMLCLLQRRDFVII